MLIPQLVLKLSNTFFIKVLEEHLEFLSVAVEIFCLI